MHRTDVLASWVMTPHTERLRALLDNLQYRWDTPALSKGTHALRRPLAPFATTFDDLDALLGGGLPRGAITELAGRTTSGMTSLAYHTIAAAQATGEMVSYLDIARTFDPFAAEAAGIVLKSLLVVLPDHLPLAMAILDDLTREGASGLVVVNHTTAIVAGWQGPQILHGALGRLTISLRHSPSTVLFLSPTTRTPPDATSLAYSAAVRLRTRGKTWHRNAEGELTGYQTDVQILKAQRHVGQSATIPFSFLDAI